MVISLTKPPSAFERPPYPKTLYIFSKEPGVLLLYDHRGFLCTCGPEDLEPLLLAQSSNYDPERPHYRMCARAVLYPEWAEEEERRTIEVRNIPPPIPYQKKAKPPPLKLSLEDLDL